MSTNEPEEQALGIDYDQVASSLTAEEATRIAEQTTIEGPDGEPIPLTLVTADILIGHEDLDSYQESGLAIAQKLKELRMEAEEQGNDAVVAMAAELEEAAFALHLRVRRGDEELFGDRDGKYSSYFEDDDAPA